LGGNVVAWRVIAVDKRDKLVVCDTAAQRNVDQIE